MAFLLKELGKTFKDLIDANKEAYDIGNKWISNRQQSIRDHARRALERSKQQAKAKSGGNKKKYKHIRK